MSRAQHNTLKAFMENHAVWDPMPIWDGQRYLLYVLAMDRARGVEFGSFFTRENAIHVFESMNLRTWRHLGIAFQARTPQERLCAGNAIYHESRYWFFGSATVDQYDDNHLDQRLFLAVSDDGVSYQEVPEFELEPDPRLCPHNRFSPLDGRMLFAWRDPWPLHDPASGRFYLFICCGGERWGRSPDVIVASADSLVGPYTLHGSALDVPLGFDAERSPAFAEIERVNVLAEGGRFYLAFSCWRRLVNTRVLEGNSRLTEALCDSSLYVAEAAAIGGPYRFNADRSPVGKGSQASGFYGSTVFSTDRQELKAIGWDRSSFRVDFTRSARVKLAPTGDGGVFLLGLRWAPHRAVALGMRRLRRRLAVSVKRSLGMLLRFLRWGKRIYVG